MCTYMYMYMYLFEGVLVEEREELQNGEVGVKLHPLEVRVHKPVEEVTALGQKPTPKTERKYTYMYMYMYTCTLYI